MNTRCPQPMVLIHTPALALSLILPAIVACQPLRAQDAGPRAILVPSSASPLERLAAKEIRRYLYLRTGAWLPLESLAPEARVPGAAILVGAKDQAIFQTFPRAERVRNRIAELGPQAYWLRTLRARRQPVWLVIGGDGPATLYAAYRLAEHLGVRFYLDGDVVPDDPLPPRLPTLDERRRPLFNLRGIQPFHDFPEGPDWWNADDYLAVLSQLPKLGMNFFGLHTYPEGAPNAEPTVWIGLAEDLAADGRVSFSYPASYQNTLRGNWGYARKHTSEFVYGAANLFERDDFGAEVMFGHMPQPIDLEGCNTVFHRAGDLLRTAFEHARALGLKTCVGTETPLTIPKAVRERLEALGKDPSDPAVLAQLYRGIFQRCARAYPLDYYWFWTPEGWTWSGTRDEDVQRTLADLRTAIDVHLELEVPFGLATCGWVLGPQQDRALFDKALPQHIAVSCINREVGRSPVDPGFAAVSGRGKWAIPWLEDDPALTSPQLWVGRMRRDAYDARRYGCDGLMGIHWRTRVLGPAVSALAAAAWDQSAWQSAAADLIKPIKTEGAADGQIAAFPGHAIADTEEDTIYQSVRYNVSAYRLEVPNGPYAVTLKFCEPHYREPGKRVFGVKLQGQTVIDRLDLFERVGPDRALDFSFPDVAVTDGWLEIEFVPIVEFPSIAAIVLSSDATTRKINCGGPSYADYAADPAPPQSEPRFPPTDDFYRDWARSLFGPEVAEPVAALFARIDGRLPRPSDWVDGPGGIRPDTRSWDTVRADYAFVDSLAELREAVKGAGNCDRFDYWLNTFRYMRAMARVNCLWHQFNVALEKTKAASDAETRRAVARGEALFSRRALVQGVAEVYQYLLATVSNPGELGTVANWEQHILPGLLEQPGQELSTLLGAPLPNDAQPVRAYAGPARIIVPTRRTTLRPGESLRLKAILLGELTPEAVTLFWRPLGTQQTFAPVPVTHVARGVCRADLPDAASQSDFEYYLEGDLTQGQKIRFPATAPQLNQTVVIMPSTQMGR